MQAFGTHLGTNHCEFDICQKWESERMSELIEPRQQGTEEAGFTEIVRLTGASRETTMQAVNTG